MADMVQYYGTGRRKTSVARVFLRPGSGKFTINSRPFGEYFVTEQQRITARRVLVFADLGATFDMVATVKGGGVTAQADAVKMGTARALLEYNIELRGSLKEQGFLTRDARMKERKKYGQKGARKRFQFSKR
ncbi:MAG TPA: 30S ribosomal protein S9 [Acidobacteriaceae bacterium]|nr:30S ribosomal protein S9 [Acidobacteriaceae bacterium]